MQCCIMRPPRQADMKRQTLDILMFDGVEQKEKIGLLISLITSVESTKTRVILYLIEEI